LALLRLLGVRRSQCAARAARAALQLHTLEPSSPLSQTISDLQAPDFCIASQSLEPTQAHRHPPSGVSKHLKSALACGGRAKVQSNAVTRRAVRIATPPCLRRFTPAKRPNHGMQTRWR